MVCRFPRKEGTAEKMLQMVRKVADAENGSAFLNMEFNGSAKSWQKAPLVKYILHLNTIAYEVYPFEPLFWQFICLLDTLLVMKYSCWCFHCTGDCSIMYGLDCSTMIACVLAHQRAPAKPVVPCGNGLTAHLCHIRTGDNWSQLGMVVAS